MNASNRRILRTPDELVRAGLLPEEQAGEAAEVAQHFAIAITPTIQDLIDPADPRDPIARQFLPSTEELHTAPEERADPIGDDAFSPVKGIVHRYPDRVLLKPILVCPVYCRFCFRREAVGSGDGTLNEAEMAAAFDYIRARPEIWEVVVTGGDPLMLPPARLGAMVAALAAIPHVSVIRFHSRVPVTDPARVTPEMAEALSHDEAMVYLALHANHPREFTPTARAAIRRLVRAGIPMLGQSVLLRGINDDAAVLEALMRAYVANGIKPYYLHHGDLARGTSHFRVSIEEGQALMRSLRGRISGLCQPTYVLDIPGGHGKVPVGPAYFDPASASVTDWQGGRHAYPPVTGPEGES